MELLSKIHLIWNLIIRHLPGPMGAGLKEFHCSLLAVLAYKSFDAQCYFQGLTDVSK